MYESSIHITALDFMQTNNKAYLIGFYFFCFSVFTNLWNALYNIHIIPQCPDEMLHIIDALKPTIDTTKNHYMEKRCVSFFENSHNKTREETAWKHT